jgi:hypothetical protein
MIANIAWNATNTVEGTVPTSEVATWAPLAASLVPYRPLSPACSNGLPIRPEPASLPNASEYP